MGFGIPEVDTTMALGPGWQVSCGSQDYAIAVRLINAHEFVNGTAVFTCSGEVARNLAHDIEAGMVGISVPIPVPMAFHSFGGWRALLFGDHQFRRLPAARD